jgi:phosphoribosylamine--glycine ligase
VAVGEGASVCLVLASRGYPAAAEKGTVIRGLEEREGEEEEITVFHAGTGRRGNDWVTAGGRVLNVVAPGADVNEARAKAYRAAERIRFDGAQLRGDIGLPGVRG